MSKTHYYIRLPASPSRGIKGGYYPVDPATLRLSMLTELYVRDGRSGRYERAYGIRPTIEIDHDPAELLERWRDLMDQIEQVMPDDGLAGDFAQELRGALDGLPQLMKLLAGGHIAEAGGALDAIGDGLVTLAATVIENLTRLQARIAEHGELAAAVTEVVTSDVHEGLYLATAESLADSIDEGLRAYRELVVFDGELDDLIRTLEPLSGVSSAGPSWVRDPISWLGDDDGFCTQASRFLIRRDPDTVDLMVTVIGQAREKLQAISTRLTEIRGQRDEVQVQAEEVLERQFEIDSLVRTMRDAREAVAKLEQSGVDPFTLVSGLITDEEFAAWQELLIDPNWQSLHAVRARLLDKAQLVHQLLGQDPSLSAADAKVVERVEQYVARVEAALADMGHPTQEPAPTAPQIKEQAARMTRPAAEDDGVDPDRLDELYELMVAVGAVKYWGAANLTGGTPHAILDLLESLERLTADEREIFSGPLRRRLATDSYVVHEGESRLGAWREIDPHQHRWIQFKQGRGHSTRRFMLWRLVEQGRDEGMELCSKHRLDPDDIVRAYDARRAARAATR